MPIHLIGATRVKDDGIDERVAKADIDQPRLFQFDFQQHVVELGTEAAVFPAHARREHFDMEAHRPKQLAEQPIELVAKSAASPHHDLLVELRDIEGDWRAERDIEIFEGNVEKMLTMQVAQCGGSWLAWSVVLDPAKIPVNIHVHTGSSS